MTPKTENLILGIILDMDGVIIDSNPYHKIAWTNFFNKRNVEVNDLIFRDLIFGTSGGEAISTLLNCQFSKDELTAFCEEIDADYRWIVRESATIEPVLGLVRFLETAVHEKHKIAIATSAPTRNVDLILQKLNLRNYFDLIIDKSLIINGKPDPEIYLKAVQGLGIVKENCVVFEDSISGIISAKKAGIVVIGVTTSHPATELIEAGAILTIDDFTEISLEEIQNIQPNLN